MRKPAQIFTLLAAIIALTAVATAGFADDFPSRPIRIIEPYPPGGPSDVGIRLMTEPLGRQLGQPLVVENKGGAGGLVGTETFLSTSPDGYTLLVGAIGPFAIIPAAEKVPYDPVKDFVPLALVWRSSQVLIVNPKLSIKTLQGFVEYAKANPGKVTLGSAGTGSITHMSIELLQQEAKIQLVHVPYHSTGETMPAVLGGQIDGAFADVTLIPQFVKSGALTAIAITAPERSSLLPDLPTTAESGLPGVDTQNWFGLVASAKTPPDIQTKLKAATAKVLVDPAYLDSVAKQGLTVKDWGADGFGSLIRSQVTKWAPVVQAAHLVLK
ncbi:MAG TPA: tripartite tricarboxylate transporter substrate binding protein [Xanthobacteraceae bacterium]|jgi:tripartite-type tricarboxylate transporter receptor subunit TctC|nr:tripartite tricarboxylate transporter substrate binding protein [Xanthobacteraceae bacterium]